MQKLIFTPPQPTSQGKKGGYFGKEIVCFFPTNAVLLSKVQQLLPYLWPGPAQTAANEDAWIIPGLFVLDVVAIGNEPNH